MKRTVLTALLLVLATGIASTAFIKGGFLSRYDSSGFLKRLDSAPFSAVPTYRLPTEADGYDMSWLNNGTLVFPLGKGSKDQPIYSWDVKTQNTSFVAPHTVLWCASDDNLTYEKSRQEIDGYFRFTMIKQTSDGQKKEFLTGLVPTPLPILSHTSDGAGWYKSDLYRGTEQFNPFDCSWDSSNDFAVNTSTSAWEYLRSGDGEIGVSAGPTSSNLGRPKTTLVHYENGSSTPVALPITADGLSDYNINYYDFQNSYFITAPEVEWHNRSTGNCRPAWWFDAKHGRVDQICIPGAITSSQNVSYIPTKKGIVRLLFDVTHALGGSKNSGAYLTAADGQTTKIWEGDMSGAVVSPNGCMLAINSQPSVVLDLCK